MQCPNFHFFMSQKEVNRKLACILSIDVVGYSHLMEENKKLISKLIDRMFFQRLK